MKTDSLENVSELRALLKAKFGTVGDQEFMVDRYFNARLQKLAEQVFADEHARANADVRVWWERWKRLWPGRPQRPGAASPEARPPCGRGFLPVEHRTMLASVR